MQLHNLNIRIGRRRKRIGRGGKRGSYSGRGVKGQKSRAGRRIRPALRDLIIRLPKRRGFSNKPLGSKPLAVNLSDLIFKLKPFLEGKKSQEVDLNILKERGLVPRRHRGAVKVVGKDKVPAGLILKGLKTSKGAKMEIEKAGGQVIETERR